MHPINMHDAKTRLSGLVEKALSGEEVVIGKAGNPLVKLTPVTHDESPRTPGRFKGRIRIADDFDAADESITRAFEGESAGTFY